MSDPGGDHTLFVAGAFELLPLTKSGMDSSDLAQALSRIYDRDGYDVGFMVPGEEEWLNDRGASVPEGWVTASDRVGQRIFDKDGVSVGVVFFPKLLKGSRTPTSMQMRAVARKAESLAERCDLVVGLSPWGGQAEQDLLKDFAPPIHLLLGSGPGPGLAGRFSDDEKTLWVRAYRRGKALHRIRVRALPTRDADWKWIKDGNVSVSLEVLNQDVQEDPETRTILDGYSLPSAK